MSLNFVTAALKADVQIQAALELVEYKQSVELGIPSAALPYLAGLFSTQCAGSLIICATDRIAQDVAAQIADFVDPNEIAYFPAWETLPHERMSPSGDTIGTRMAILRQLANPNESSEIKNMDFVKLGQFIERATDCYENHVPKVNKYSIFLQFFKLN